MKAHIEARQPDSSVDSFEIVVDGERVGKPIDGATAKEIVVWLRDAWWDLLGLMAEDND